MVYCRISLIEGTERHPHIGLLLMISHRGHGGRRDAPHRGLLQNISHRGHRGHREASASNLNPDGHRALCGLCERKNECLSIRMVSVDSVHSVRGKNNRLKGIKDDSLQEKYRWQFRENSALTVS